MPGGAWVRVGSLGIQYFPQGTYAYVGSAMNGLESRIRRHFSREKKIRWHIDYLLDKAEALQAIILPNERRMECALNNYIDRIPGSRVVSEGFGSSDCDCRSHLHLIPSDSIGTLQDLPGSHLWVKGIRAK